VDRGLPTRPLPGGSESWTRSTIQHLLLVNLNLHACQQPGEEGRARLARAFFALASRVKPTLFCDVGAFDGAAAAEFKRQNPECRVFAFEANPEVFARFAMRHNDSGVNYRNVAIDEKSGTVTLYAPRTASRLYIDGRFVETLFEEPPNSGRSSVLLRNEDATYAEFDVPGRPLDDLIRTEGIDLSNEIVVLWIDVEGAIHRVMQGASQTLARTAVLLVETETESFWREQHNSAQVCTALMDLGFIPVARDREYDDFQFNILFVHADYLAGVDLELFVAASPLRACYGDSNVAKPVASELLPSSGELSPNTLPVQESSQPRSVESTRSIAELFQHDIPILIPTFENPTYVRHMIEQLRWRGLSNIVVVDNASISPEMRDFLQSDLDARIIRLDRNYGPRHIFLDDESYFSLPDLFCVTDPDLELNPDLPADFLGKLVSLTERYQVGKAGFSLDISDRAALRQEKFNMDGTDYTIWDWEQQFWMDPVGELGDLGTIYRATIDTTFALYNKRYFDRRRYMNAVRVAGVFTCRHLPWYQETGLPPQEEFVYRQYAQHSFYLGAAAPRS
jgi:FkbM family methyltransferase